MKNYRWLAWGVLAGILACGVATAAKKTSQIQPKQLKDPIVIIAGGGGSFSVGNLFQILSPSGTSPLNLLNGSACVIAGLNIPDCIFQNGTSSTWTTLTFSISPGNQIGPFTCLALAYFSKCSFNQDGTSVTFSGGRGIAAGQDFLVAVLLWLPGTIFAGSATPSNRHTTALLPRQDRPAQEPLPESSTMPVFIRGHAAAINWRRLRVAGGSGT